MKTYQVDGRLAVIEADQVVRLTAEQFEARSHNVDVLTRQNGIFVVRARTPLQFKRGEQIGVEALPRELTSVLLPIEGVGSRTGLGRR